MNTLPLLVNARERTAWDSALEFAVQAHGNQLRKYTNDPYWLHPAAVGITVSHTPYRTPEAIQAALLHDVLEDTNMPYSTINGRFGRVVADYVQMLTDPPKASGNRAARKAVVKARLMDAPAMVKTIKLADMIDNTSSITKYDPDFAKTYMREKADLLESLEGGDQSLYDRAYRIVVRYFVKEH
jgi:(p)ppGpp synthase/HD superfamily hydrolase